jgi:gas vesicle protein
VKSKGSLQAINRKFKTINPMPLFSKKTTFLIGSVIGSVAGLLFASESGKQLRSKLLSARTPQKKFEVLFQEYLKAGKAVLSEVEDSAALKEIVKGGKEILVELQKRAKKEGTAAVKLAQKKTAELIREAESAARAGAKTATKQVKKTIQMAQKTANKKVSAARKTANKKVAKAKKTVKKVAKKVRK